jgi:uncharacterized protein (TIGR02271 family)
MAETQNAGAWRGRTMIDRDGGYVGSIQAVYVDEESGQPHWALVRLGVAGTRSTFVPIARAATTAAGDVRVPYGKEFVKQAPGVEPDRPLTAAGEGELFRHYGLEHRAGEGEATTEGAAAEQDAGQDLPGGAGDDAMTRSEEEVHVGTETRERGRVRLRKYVTTEEVHLTVPVRREKVRLEWEPAGDADADPSDADREPDAPSGEDVSDAEGAEGEVVLQEQAPVVEKRTVPEERLRLDEQTVTDQQLVSDEVRKEQLDLDQEG